MEQNQTCEQALELSLKAQEQLKEQLTYLSADLENMRKRFEKERAQWSTFAQIELIKKLLPIIDDFDRAFSNTYNQDIQSQLQGFELVYKAFQKYLKDTGVEEITDTNFDPEKHEAIMQVSDESKPAGSIAQVLQKGYVYKNVIIRPAQVSVIA